MHKNDEPVLSGPPLGLGLVLKKSNETSLWHVKINISVAAENYWELVANRFYQSNVRIICNYAINIILLLTFCCWSSLFSITLPRQNTQPTCAKGVDEPMPLHFNRESHDINILNYIKI